MREIPEITEEFPGWKAWESLGARQLHARKQDTDPAFVVHDDTLDGLRGQIGAHLGPAR